MAETISRKTAIVGVGETTYYKRGAAPEAEFKLGLTRHPEGGRRRWPEGQRHRRLRVV